MCTASAGLRPPMPAAQWHSQAPARARGAAAPTFNLGRAGGGLPLDERGGVDVVVEAGQLPEAGHRHNDVGPLAVLHGPRRKAGTMLAPSKASEALLQLAVRLPRSAPGHQAVQLAGPGQAALHACGRTALLAAELQEHLPTHSPPLHSVRSVPTWQESTTMKRVALAPPSGQPWKAQRTQRQRPHRLPSPNSASGSATKCVTKCSLRYPMRQARSWAPQLAT